MPDPPAFSPLDDPPDAPLDELRRREDAWHASQRVSALWPGLDAASIQRAADAIGAAVAAVLRGERARLDFPLPHTGADAERRIRALGVAGMLTGVGPLLGLWIERGELDTDAPPARALARHLAHGRARAARIRAELLPVLAQMSHAGLEPGVMKGFHTAHVHYPEAGARPFADVDVVVAPGAVARAEQLLAGAGFVADRRVGGATSYKREWYPPGGKGDVWSHELWHARTRWKLDLHDGLNFNEVVQTVRAAQTPRFTEVLELEGVPLRIADTNETIALVAAHGSTELYVHRLLRLVELVLVARRGAATGTLDWAAVESSLAERASLPFAYPMLSLAERLAPGTVDAPTLERLRGATTARARTLTRGWTATAPILSGGPTMRERLIWATGARATARRLWRMVAPIEGASARERLREYRHRALRLLALARSPRGRRSDGGRDG